MHMLLEVLGTILLLQPQVMALDHKSDSLSVRNDANISQNIYINPNLIKRKSVLNPNLLKQIHQIREPMEMESHGEGADPKDLEPLIEVVDEEKEIDQLIITEEVEEDDNIGSSTDDSLDIGGEYLDNSNYELEDEGSEEEMDEPINDEMEITEKDLEEAPQECLGKTFGEKLACSLLDSLKESLSN